MRLLPFLKLGPANETVTRAMKKLTVPNEEFRASESPIKKIV